MNVGITLSFLVGFCAVLQAALNKTMSNQIGLAHSILIGNCFIVVLNLIFFWSVQKYPHFYPEFMHFKGSLTAFKGWYLIPALFGFTIVAGLPYAYFRADAVKVTITMVAAQMMASVLWDLLVEKIPFQANKGLGIFFALLSVFFILR